MRPSAALIVTFVALLLAGCSGSSSGGSGSADESVPVAPPGDSLEALWRGPGEAVAVVAGTSDHAVGPNRISFLIANSRGELVERKRARVWLAWGKDAKPFAETTATLEPVGVPGGAKADALFIYVINVKVARAGTLWYVARPVGARIQAIGTVKVAAATAAPAIGARAVPSQTPTLRSTGGDLDELTTSTRVDRALYKVSVAEALAAKTPFLVTFATPQFCQTRVCGPVVEVVSAARRRLAGTGVRFIHVEVYEDNNPGKGANRWVREWKLPTEPFTFVVDREGRVSARFEGAVSVGELVTALRRVA